MMKVAVDIETEVWNTIISTLKADGWRLKYDYKGFDKGIDHDFLMLKKEKAYIYFGWTNWFEGEIKCSDNLFRYLSTTFQITFCFGEPTALKANVIQMEKIKSLFGL
ncbi:MAG: hypothetical protein AAGI23_12650 [Bacteroidota bacterium]